MHFVAHVAAVKHIVPHVAAVKHIVPPVAAVKHIVPHVAAVKQIIFFKDLFWWVYIWEKGRLISGKLFN